MAYIYQRRTGRTRTLTAVGAFNLPSRGRAVSHHATHEFKQHSGAYLSCIGFRITGDQTTATDDYIQPSTATGDEIVEPPECEEYIDYDTYSAVGVGIAGYGASDGDAFNIALTGQTRCSVFTTLNADLSLVCSYEFSVETEEWAFPSMTVPTDINPATEEPYDAARGYAKYLWHPNGEYPETPLIDGVSAYLPYGILVYYEVAKPGGAFSGSVSINGNTVSISGTLDDSRPIIDHRLYSHMFVRNNGYSEDSTTPTTTATLESYVDGLPVNFSSSPSAVVNNVASYVSGNEFGILTVRGKSFNPSAAFSSVFGGFERRAIANASPDMQYRVELDLLKPNGEHVDEQYLIHGTWNTPEKTNPPDSYPLQYLYNTIEVVGGELRADVDLQNCDLLVYDGVQDDIFGGVMWNFDFGSGIYTTSEFARAWQVPMGMGFDAPELNTIYGLETPGDLAAKNLDPRAWLILIEDPRRFDAAHIRLGEEHTVDEFSSTTGWTAGANSTVALTGGDVTISASGGTGGAAKAIGGDWNWRNYRDAEITLACSETATIEVGVVYLLWDGAEWAEREKTWEVEATTTPTALPMSLIGPTSATMDTDQTDDSFIHQAPPQFRPDGDNDPSEAVGHLYGVGPVEALTIALVPDGATLTLKSLKLKRETDASAALLTAMHTFATSDSPAYRPEGKSALLTYSDRKRATELAYAVYLFGDYLNTKLPTMHEALGRFQASEAEGAPGFTSWSENTEDNHADIGDLIMGETAYLDTWDYAAGWLATTVSSSDRAPLLDADIRDGVMLQLCVQCHHSQGYIGCGDPSGDYGGRFPVRSTWVAPVSIEEGLVQDADTRAPVAGAVVRILDGTSPVETMITDAKGFFRSASRVRSQAGDLIVETEQSGVQTLPMPRRFRQQRLSGEATVQLGTGLSYHVSRSMRHARAYVRDSQVWTGVAPNSLTPKLSWTDRNTLIEGSDACIRWSDAYHRLRLLTVASGTVYERISDNEGGLWGVPTTIGTGTRATMFISDDGRRFYYWRTSGGALKTLALDAQGNTLVAETTIVASGVDDDSLAADDAILAGGGHVAAVLYRSSGSIVELRSSDYTTYS